MNKLTQLLTAATTLLSGAQPASTTPVPIHFDASALPLACTATISTQIAGQDITIKIDRLNPDSGMQVTSGMQINLSLDCGPNQLANKILKPTAPTNISFTSSPNNWDTYIGQVPGLQIDTTK